MMHHTRLDFRARGRGGGAPQRSRMFYVIDDLSETGETQEAWVLLAALPPYSMRRWERGGAARDCYC